MLMLSGGKDSMYMLYKLITKDNARPLAFTLNHPYESKNANSNIEKAIEKLGVDHICYTPNLHKYKILMNKIFTENQETIREKIINRPCMMCTSVIMVSAYIYAYKLGIPYILYCADPHQSTYISDNIRHTISNLVNTYGTEFLYEFFDEEPIRYILEKDDKTPPYLVFPYMTMDDYNPEKIISELKSLDLYDSSPIETHCSLYGLLNYYSFKRHDCHYYARELSVAIRAGDIDRSQAVGYLEQYKNIILNLAVKDELTCEEKKYIRDVLKLRFPNSTSEAEREYEYVMSLKKISKELGVELDNI